MKTPLIISLFFLLSCNEVLLEPQVSQRSDFITYNPHTGCAGQVVAVSFNNGYGNNCGRSRIQRYMNGAWVTMLDAVPVNGIITYDFVPPATGEYRFRASWNKSGKECLNENIKPFEEDPLIVESNCCRDYFTATAICDTHHDCPYGIEFNFSTTMDTWITLVGVLPAGYEICGIFDEFGAIIEDFPGNTMEIGGDFYACQDVKFFVYFRTTDPTPSFGTWTVLDMHGVLYRVEPPPCILY